MFQETELRKVTIEKVRCFKLINECIWHCVIKHIFFLLFVCEAPTLNDLLISLDCEFTHTLNNKVLPVCLISPQGPCDTLGISLAGGVGSLHGNTPLFIASMDTNRLAAKTEKLEVSCQCVYLGFTHYMPSK